MWAAKWREFPKPHAPSGDKKSGFSATTPYISKTMVGLAARTLYTGEKIARVLVTTPSMSEKGQIILEASLFMGEGGGRRRAS